MKKPKSHSRQRPSFFKVLIHYTTKLSLPPLFVRNFRKLIPKTAKLRTTSGETWDVKLKEEIGDDDGKRYLCFIGRGWAKFVKDLELKFGEFLVFFLNVTESTFDVSVFGTNLCERRRSSHMEIHSDVATADTKEIKLENDSDIVPDDSRKRLRGNCIPESEGGERPHFKILLNENRKWRWCIPTMFIKEAKLSGKGGVVLEYVAKKRYQAVILNTNARFGKRVDMSTGWNEFRVENGLEMGKTYSFQFNPAKNVIQVKLDDE